MIDAIPTESHERFAAKFTRRWNVRLAGAAGGLVLALLISPGSRRLLVAQAELTVPVSANVASLAGGQLGIQANPFESRTAARVSAATAERHPDDLQVQIANACSLLPDGKTPTSLQKVQRLRALKSRFGDSPSLYANVLRYDIMGEISAHHSVDQRDLSGEPITNDMLENARKEEAQSLNLVAYSAYDQDCAEGERLDPDNAYFPFMRAIGLFGVHRDGEALEAVALAARKPLWREYYNDEVRGQWRLQDEGFVNNSAILHSLSAMFLLFPQYAQMRSAARVTIHAAMQAEQSGHVKEGLAMRENVARLGSLMSAHSASLIGSLVGNAVTETAIARPGGEEAIKSDERNEKQTIAARRGRFDAYLRRINAGDAQDTFHAAQQASDQAREIVHEGSKLEVFEQPLKNLITWWVVDLVTLANILWLLVLGGIAGLCLRSPRLRAGTGLPGYARFALPTGIVGGILAAPFLLAGGSNCFQSIAFDDRSRLMFAGLTPLLFLLVFPAATFRERMNRVGVFAGSWLAGAVLTGGFFWQARGAAGIALLMQVCFNLSNWNESASSALTSGLLWLTPCVSLLMLIGIAIGCRVCRIPLSVGLARGFRGLMVPLAAILCLIYGGMLVFTIRAEAAVQYSLERTLDNEAQYIADMSGKQWPRTDANKAVGSK